jgi:hypothetical protein
VAVQHQSARAQRDSQGEAPEGSARGQHRHRTSEMDVHHLLRDRLRLRRLAALENRNGRDNGAARQHSSARGKAGPHHEIQQHLSGTATTERVAAVASKQGAAAAAAVRT